MPSLKQVFVPLVFKPGEVCQFDWSQEVVELDGVEQVVRAAYFRLCYSRKMFVVAYLREVQEMLIDAHNKAFAFFGGDDLRQSQDDCGYCSDRQGEEIQPAVYGAGKPLSV